MDPDPGVLKSGTISGSCKEPGSGSRVSVIGSAVLEFIVADP
jgi:hypothetical protein